MHASVYYISVTLWILGWYRALSIGLQCAPFPKRNWSNFFQNSNIFSQSKDIYSLHAKIHSYVHYGFCVFCYINHHVFSPSLIMEILCENSRAACQYANIIMQISFEVCELMNWCFSDQCKITHFEISFVRFPWFRYIILCNFARGYWHQQIAITQQ